MSLTDDVSLSEFLSDDDMSCYNYGFNELEEFYGDELECNNVKTITKAKQNIINNHYIDEVDECVGLLN